jgi:hypothetical protein
MKISSKTGIVLGTVGIIFWASLFVLFYMSPNEYGTYAEMDFGKAKGESTERFRIASDDILLTSKRANIAGVTDIILLVRKFGSLDTTLYIIRGQDNLIFEQAISSDFSEVSWDKENKRFVVTTSDNTDSFWLTLDEKDYILVPAQ